ncbi:MAG: dipeptide ABC transporter ATP-binding protein [Elainellaceae cyanobacterium]
MSNALFCIEHVRVAYPQTSPQNLSSAKQSVAASPQTWAVDDVSLTLMPGERLGLVGESGCGKSTLGRAAMRLLPSSTHIEGTVLFKGQSVFDLSADALRTFRGEAIALIFQDPMTRLDPLMTIGNHCIETLLAHDPHLSRQDARQRGIEILDAVNIPASRWGQYPHEFSGGMRQRVAIALALLLNPKLIVADEPTTSLDVTVSAQILKELTRLCRERQMALMLISHDLTLVGEYCDRIAVMYDGKIVETGTVESVLTNPQHSYTQSLLSAALHLQRGESGSEGREGSRARDGAIAPSSPQIRSANSSISSSSPPLLSIRHLKQHYTLEQNFIARLFSQTSDRTIKAVDDVSLDIFPGEILGLVGESGCGKSTLSRTILRLVHPTSGTVEFLQQDLTALSPDEMRRQRRQMQMIFQDPHACLNPLMTVGQGIASPLLIHQLAHGDNIAAHVNAMLERVGLTPPDEFYHRYPNELSGGQQQRVAIARALITRPKLLICDEPVSMLDASIQSQVLELMLELKQEFDLTYLFITHDLWVARYFCDRIAVMQAGQIVEYGTTDEIFSNPQHPYTQTLLNAAPLLTRWHNVAGPHP